MNHRSRDTSAPRERILEGIVTTINEDDTTNISPMGPWVDAAMSRLTLRPFQSSTTYCNLKRRGEGVLHITDDVELLARAAVGVVAPPVRDASAVSGRILVDACRWYAFRVVELDDREERTTIRCEVVDSGRQRDFFGLNRAKHAVVEAAILATRVGILPDEKIRREMEALEILVAKTGGDDEHRAFVFLTNYISERLGS
jgi:hypothetical protein